MSEYQYHEFCRLHSPMPQNVRNTMKSFSSRAVLSTHGAAYTYNYSDFDYEPIEILQDYFDVYFYIANWGTVRLAFKFDEQVIDINDLVKYTVDNVIKVTLSNGSIVVTIELGCEEGFGWTEGEGMLVDLLPLYDEIKNKNYHCLDLAKAINETLFMEDENSLANYLANNKLSKAQNSLLNIMKQAF
jgi:hypothetical protein